MEQVILVIHIIVATSIIAVVLIQRSEGGGLGIGGSGGGLGNLATVRGTADFLTRLTAILAACFMGTSLLLAVLASQNAPQKSILEVDTSSISVPVAGEETAGDTEKASGEEMAAEAPVAGEETSEQAAGEEEMPSAANDDVEEEDMDKKEKAPEVPIGE